MPEKHKQMPITKIKFPAKSSENFEKVKQLFAELDDTTVNVELLGMVMDQVEWSQGDTEDFNHNTLLLTKLLGETLTKGYKSSFIPGQKRSRMTSEQVKLNCAIREVDHILHKWSGCIDDAFWEVDRCELGVVSKRFYLHSKWLCCRIG